MKVRIRLRVRLSLCSEGNGVVGSADGNAATIGCSGTWVVGVAFFTGGLLLGFSLRWWARVSWLSPFNRLSNWDASGDIIMSSLCCAWSSGLGSCVAWAALGSTLLDDFSVGDSAEGSALGDWCTLSPSIDWTTAERGEAWTGGVGSKGAWAWLFSKGVLGNLTESVLDAGVGEGAGRESEDDEGLFHFE